MTLDEELSAIGRMSKTDLKDRWKKVIRRPAPGSLSITMLRSGLVYELQAQRFGALSASARRRLERMAAKLAKDPDVKLLAGETPAPGARLVREWRGQRHVVEVLHQGFVYRGNIYASLSEIARRITGARWSGPRFFGLKNRRRTT